MALNCARYECVHNNTDGACFANIIRMRGIFSDTTDETTCASFLSRSANSYVEFAGELDELEFKANESNIFCEAGKCIFNHGGDCKAKGVKIEAENAQCEAFKP